ncbi:4-hydroxybenzoate polyprenyltransferase, mitochondrial [Quillaja saponaria]|uniref:4-hydroxybenzoate polyprenyltransferase, mitochondrial n=1 Tax=Quillaja saponaria TaxID=32244 RepID=A0AAD7LKM6_QUISA|nr:4-hydroxybenzoate polyprenyltransferase, mitochondrial [Quillaja saponaria]KAJ7959628.1 4-hydroxybenzoate polyprenyltransferase, mitochondrial [Quillaja saponaria]
MASLSAVCICGATTSITVSHRYRPKPSHLSVLPAVPVLRSSTKPFNHYSPHHSNNFLENFGLRRCFRFVNSISTPSSSSSSITSSKTVGEDDDDEDEDDDDDVHHNGSISSKSWVDILPTQLRPYVGLSRIQKPIGTWLLIWPTMWSIALATSQGHIPDLKTMILCGLAAIPFRGSACTINDFFDRDVDKMVERTKSRPLASGVISPVQALLFYGFQMLLGIGSLLSLNKFSLILGIPFLFLFSTYPLMKRLTYWPQAYLGLAWNWGIFFGWAAIKESMDLVVTLPMFIAGVSWTLVYDTIYAHQDKEDDQNVGVKSTALLFGDSTKQWTTGFAIACIAGFALSGFHAGLGWPYYVCLAAAAGHLAWQIWTVDLSSGDDCSNKFVSNQWFGAIVFAGTLVGRLLT